MLSISVQAGAQGLYPVHPWSPMPQPGIHGGALLPVLPPPPALGSTSWTPIGPAPLAMASPPNASSNVSGRIAGIAADPGDANVIYVAPAGGGVWKTTDGGTSWSPLTDAQTTLSMGAIAIAPGDPNVLYAGTGEANNSADSNYGRGILTSTDAGATWTLRTAGGAFDRLTTSKIAVDPTDADVAYAALASFGNNGIFFSPNTGIWKTTDGGASWTNTTTAIETTLPWSDVAIDPNDHLTLYAAVGYLGGAPTNGVYKSTDGGASWTLLAGAPKGTGAGRITIAVGTSDSQVVYASASNPGVTFGALISLERSDDGGATWHDLTAGTPNYFGGQGWYDTTLIVDPTASTIVYAGGAAGPNSVLRSTDGGATWADISTGGPPSNTSPHVDHHAVAFDVNGKLLDGDDGGIYRLDDPTVPSWTNLNGNLQTIQFTGIGLHPTDLNIAIGGSQDNGTEVYGGSIVWLETDGGDGGFAKFSPTNGSRAYHQIPNLSFGTNFFRRSDDGGSTWATKTASISADVNDQNFYAPFVVDPGNGDRVLYGTNRVWETTDGGDSWNTISNVGTAGFNNGGDDVDTIGLAPSTADVVYAATGGTFASTSKIFVTTDHGSSWNEVDLPVGGRVNELQVDPADPAIAYAVVNTFNGANGQVFETIDGGTTWTNISGNLPVLPVWSLQIDSVHGKLFVGNDDGVYATTDGGATWSRYKTGLPHAQVFQIELKENLGLLGAGTHGRGMWEILVGTCGDGNLDPGEQCDDGNTLNGDCCSSTCQLQACTIAVAKDAFLRKAPHNTNEGGNSVLAVRNRKNRTLVGFDLTGKNVAALSSAKLVLTVNRNLRGWGSSGKDIEAHALLQDFAEGNGMLLKSRLPTRGSGPGVTYECAVDTEIANVLTDCPASWGGGDFVTAATDSVTHTNATAGAVSYDVTADVKAGANEWLLKRASEHGSGGVLYYSREGAALAGDPTLAPRLELDY